jgi:hypothetical protein
VGIDGLIAGAHYATSPREGIQHLASEFSVEALAKFRLFVAAESGHRITAWHLICASVPQNHLHAMYMHASGLSWNF